VMAGSSGTEAPVTVGAADFEALYCPLLGLWATGGCRAVNNQLPHVPAQLAALADAVRLRARVHPLLGNTLVRLLQRFVSDLTWARAAQQPCAHDALTVVVMSSLAMRSTEPERSFDLLVPHYIHGAVCAHAMYLSLTHAARVHIVPP